MAPPPNIIDISYLTKPSPLKRKADQPENRPQPLPSKDRIAKRVKSNANLSQTRIDMTPTTTPAQISASPLRLVSNIIRRVKEDDISSSVSVNGDDVDMKDPSEAFKVTDLTKTFPSIVKMYNVLRQCLTNADLQEARQMARLFIDQVLDALRAMEELPRDMRQKESFEGSFSAVQTFLKLLQRDFAGLPDKFRVETPSQIKAKFTPIVARLDKLKRALELHIRYANEVLVNHPDADKRRTVAEVAESFLRSRRLNTATSAEDLAELLSGILATPPEDLNKTTCPATTILDDRMPMTFELKNFLLSHEMFNGLKLVKEQATEKAKRDKATVIKGTSISPEYIPSSPSTFFDAISDDTLTGSIKSAFQAIKKKESGKLNPNEERAYRVRDSVLRVDDPLKKKGKVQLLPPTGEAAKMTATRSGIKAITVAGIVYFLTLPDPDKYVPELTSTVMTCFRIFTTPTEFFAQLVARYMEEPEAASSNEQIMAWAVEAANVRVRIVHILLDWIAHYWHREEDIVILKDLIVFVNSCLADKSLAIFRASTIIQTMCRAILKGPHYEPLVSTRKQKERVLEATAKLPILHLTSFKFDGTFSIDHCVGNPTGILELARQITLLASQLYCGLNTGVLVKYWLNSGGLSPKLAEDIRKAVCQDSYLSCMVQFDILSQHRPEKRAKRVEMWIDVAEECIAMRNFWGAHAIITSCAGSSIRRLRATVTLVSLAYRTKWHHIDDLFHTKNYAGYRKLLSSKELVPTIPLLAALVHDIVHCYEWEVKDKRTDGLFELQRVKTTYATIDAMENCRIPYNFAPHAEIQAFIQLEYAQFAKIGLDKVEPQLLYRYSDRWADIENKHISENGSQIWLAGVPEPNRRNSLIYIFPQA